MALLSLTMKGSVESLWTASFSLIVSSKARSCSCISAERNSTSLKACTVERAMGTPDDGSTQKHMACPMLCATPIQQAKCFVGSGKDVLS
jgi:hypothetical protein